MGSDQNNKYKREIMVLTKITNTNEKQWTLTKISNTNTNEKQWVLTKITKYKREIMGSDQNNKYKHK